jgi:hypothetical protein
MLSSAQSGDLGMQIFGFLMALFYGSLSAHFSLWSERMLAPGVFVFNVVNVPG